MFSIEKDLDRIHALATQKERENHRFRLYLKQRELAHLCELVDRINFEVASAIDCTECGNCCTILKPFVTDKEITNLSRATHKSKEEFTECYTDYLFEENARILKDTPCAFLVDKRCTVYDRRPHDCKSFPHIKGNTFTHRTIEMVENSAICPIVYNVLERMKRELRFH